MTYPYSHDSRPDNIQRHSTFSMSLAPWLLALACAFWATQPQAQELPASQFYGATEYIAGGIGSEESQLFRQSRKDFPLSIVFARQTEEGKSAYTSDAQLVIRNANDQTVLNSTIDGPFCLVRLAPGNYKVFATLEGKTLSREVSISEAQTREINFQWPQ